LIQRKSFVQILIYLTVLICGVQLEAIYRNAYKNVDINITQLRNHKDKSACKIIG